MSSFVCHHVGQDERDSRTFSRLAGNLNGSSVGVHNALDDGQAQAQTTSPLL